MLVDRNKFFIAGTTAVLALVSSGCGRTQSSLLPRVNVGQLMDEDSQTESVESAEQYANNKIDSELRKRKSAVAEASDTILASAEEEGRSWKDRLLPKKADLPTAEDFGTDPFLDGLDGMIAEQDAKLKKVAEQRSELSELEAAELFGDFTQQAGEALADLDQAATETVARTEDVFGAAAEDIFGAEPTTAPQPTTNELEQASRSGAGRRTVAERVNGAVVHRFDDLFDEAQSQVQRVAGQTRESVREVMAAAAPAHAAPREPHQLNLEPTPSEIQVPQVPVAPAIEDMFEPPAEPVEVAVKLPEMPDFPQDTVANFEQQDAVVTPNRPAALPAPPEPEPELSDNDFAAMDRVEVDPYEEPSFAAAPSFGDAPSFSETESELPSVDNFPPVEIPTEPAPRFAAQEPKPVQTEIQRVVQDNQPATPAAFSTPAPQQAPPAVAAVLPDVNWQEHSATPRTLRAPSEWTAWFLMGGAALIVMLLFAPGRRE